LDYKGGYGIFHQLKEGGQAFMFQQPLFLDGSGNEGSMTGTGNPLKDVFPVDRVL
jgi:hypothetical protein